MNAESNLSQTPKRIDEHVSADGQRCDNTECPLSQTPNRIDDHVSADGQRCDNTECPVCCEEFVEFDAERAKSVVFLESCRHLICHDCLLEWSKEKQNCPICRCAFTKAFFQHDKSFASEFAPVCRESGSSVNDEINTDNTQFAWSNVIGHSLIARTQVYFGAECVYDSAQEDNLRRFYRENVASDRERNVQSSSSASSSQAKSARRSKQKAQQQQNKRAMRQMKRNQKR